MEKLAMFSKNFEPMTLKYWTPNYEKAHLLSIGNIAAKLEDATPCIHRADKIGRRPPAKGHNHNPNVGCGLMKIVIMKLESNQVIHFRAHTCLECQNSMAFLGLFQDQKLISRATEQRQFLNF